MDAATLYLDQYGRVYHHLRHRCEWMEIEDAKDIASDAFLEMMLKGYEMKVSVWMWLGYKRAYSLKDSARCRHETRLAEDAFAVSFPPPEVEVYKMASLFVWGRRAEAFDMLMQGYNYEEIENILGCKEGYVRDVIYYLRKKLAADLKNDVRAYRGSLPEKPKYADRLCWYRKNKKK